MHDTWGAWCAKFGPPLDIVSAAPAVLDRISIRPPTHTVWENPLEEAYYGAGEGRSVAKHQAVSLYHLKDVSIAGSESFMFTEPHKMLRLDPSMNDFSLRKVRRPISWLARRVDGPVLSLGSRSTENYGHFLCEHLPLVLLARERLGAGLPLKILATPDQAWWQAEYLARLGENPENVVEGSRGTVFCPDVWLVPSVVLAERSDLYEPEVYREIARRFKRGVRPRRKDRSLFLTRRDAPRRRLVNEDEVFAALQRVYPNLERVSLARMSLQSQIELFAEARVVVGTTGQELRYLLFCEGALSIQLVPGNRAPENTYHLWAANFDRLGLTHGNRCLSLYAEEPYRQGDWVFPIEALKKALKRLETLDEARVR